MNISILDVIGPVMVGPSSSHTAGALKLARAAMQIAGESFERVVFGLHGSFEKTGAGHGTDMALLSGAMGLNEKDERIRDAFKLAYERGLCYEFAPVELGDTHENTCRMSFYHPGGQVSEITGSSIGGGLICITEVDGIPTEITATNPTLVVRQYDRKGVIGAVSNLLAENDINIAIMRLGREARGAEAITVIETDSPLPSGLCEKIEALDNVIFARVIDI